MRFLIRLALFCLVVPPAFAGTVSTFSGEKLTGVITFVDRSLVLTGGDGQVHKIAPADILEAQIADPAKDASKGNFPGGVILVNGTAVPIAPKSKIAEMKLVLGSKPVTVQPAAIAKYVYESAPWSALDSDAEGTGVLLRNGDFFAGKIGSVEGGDVRVNSLLFGPRKFDLKKSVAAIVVRDERDRTSTYRIRTTAGARLSVDALEFTSTGVSLRDSILGTVLLPGTEIAEISAGPGRFEHLVSAKPFRIDPPADIAPELALTKREPGADGQPGLIAAVNAAITYSIPPGFTVFAGIASIPATVPVGIPLVFAVYIDGKRAFQSPAMTSADTARPIRFVFGAARHITLRIEPGATAPGGLSAEWLAPTLLKTGR